MMTTPNAFPRPQTGYEAPIVSGIAPGIGEIPQRTRNTLPEQAEERERHIAGDVGRAAAMANASQEHVSNTLRPDYDWQVSAFEADKRQHAGLYIKMDPSREEEHTGKTQRAREALELGDKQAAEDNVKYGKLRDQHRSVTGYINFANREGTPLTVHKVKVPSPNRQTRRALVAIEREGQARLRAEARRVKGARLGPEADLEAVAMTLDKRGAEPDFTVTFNGGAFDVSFPRVVVHAEARGGDVPFAYDYVPSYIRANRDAILAKAREVIADHYMLNDLQVMDAVAKKARLRQIADELLESQRVECEHIWLARDEGESIDFAAETDPRAILGVDGPAPPRARR